MKLLVHKINWVWRLFMTGMLFASFSLGGWLLSHLFLYCIQLQEKDAVLRVQKTRLWVARSFRLFLHVAQKTGVLKLHLQNKELLQQDQGKLMVANHPTLLDYVIIASVVDQIDCVVKAKLLQNIFIGKLIRQLNYLPNNDDPEKFLQLAQKKLAAGHNILIFPEGTRTTKGQPMTLQRGASRVALYTKCQLRLMHMACSESILGKDNHWFHVPRQKPVFTLQVGTIVDSQQYHHYITEDAIAARQLTKDLTQLLQPLKH